MKISEIIERNFTVDSSGRVIDDAGNEYRDEEGMVNLIEDKMRVFFDEFISLLDDDPDFNYDENEFVEWLKDHDLEKGGEK